MGKKDVRLANEAWEALLRAQMTIARELRAADIWDELLENEYTVLHTLSQAPAGMRIVDLVADVLITKAGLSRLIARMEERGLVVREDDPDDGRASRIRLTAEGTAKQQRIGRAHVRHIAEEMTGRLDHDQLIALRDACRVVLQPVPVCETVASPS